MAGNVRPAWLLKLMSNKKNKQNKTNSVIRNLILKEQKEK